MIIKWLFCFLCSFCVGNTISLAFAALVNSIGLIRNLIVKHNTKVYQMYYTVSLIIGVVFASVVSFYPNTTLMLGIYGKIICAIIGIFYGCFVGFLAIALAEIFDVIPVLNNKLGFRYNLKVLIITIAIGKFLGSLLYFAVPGFYEY